MNFKLISDGLFQVFGITFIIQVIIGMFFNAVKKESLNNKFTEKVEKISQTIINNLLKLELLIIIALIVVNVIRAGMKETLIFLLAVVMFLVIIMGISFLMRYFVKKLTQYLNKRC